MDWIKIPKELRDRSQWCIAGAPGMFTEKGKEPLGLSVHNQLYFAKVNEPSTWLPFDVAANYAWQHNLNIGYVLSEDDPYACIDFDVKDVTNAPDKPETWTPRESYDFFFDCIRRFDSYTETSVSKKGFHTWVKGKIGRGVRAHGIEIYSQERFIICTGDVTLQQPIEYREPQLCAFAEYIRPKTFGEEIVLEEVPEVEDDWHILQTAFYANNAEKFTALWFGNWESIIEELKKSEFVDGVVIPIDRPKQAYPSQSEADLALLSMLTFYSPSNIQVRRMFRASYLGRREKATKDDVYLNRTIGTIRAREKRETFADVDAIAKSAEYAERMARAEINRLQGVTDPITVQPLHVAGLQVPEQHLPNTPAAVAIAAPLPHHVLTAGTTGIPWPPGVAGRIAQFVYQSAPRPVKEVAIVAAIGLLAGICGKGWHIPQSGLNMYITLIAQSGVGKEAMHSGISSIAKAVNMNNPIFYNFINFNDFASGPALQKGCAMNSCFVHVSGEWGKKLKLMAEAENGRNQSMTTLRTIMTNLYQKSGPAAIVGGIQYSQAENNISSVSGVAYSMIGETTPGTFYESLTPEMMEDGFLSRFLNIEYVGARPSANPNQVVVPDNALVEVLSNLATAANSVVTATHQSIAVGRDNEAAKLMADFEDECDREINSSKSEAYRQMWNRASLKSMRLAALLAVADHHLYPCVNALHSAWAIDVVRRDIAIMQRKMEGGDVGTGDKTRERKMMQVLKNYLKNELPKTHHDSLPLKKQGIIARKYIQIYTWQSTSFNKFRAGAVPALNITIQSFIDNGYLVEIPRDKAVKDYGFHGRCYRIQPLPETDFHED